MAFLSSSWGRRKPMPSASTATPKGRRYFFRQPVIAGIGAAEILLAWRWQPSGKIVTLRRRPGSR
jgi:hypothetical protein